jgi:hypothetical protein
MRKLSELLKICTGYHSYWGAIGGAKHMCHAAALARIDDAISEHEKIFVADACMGVVESINPGYASIENALLFGLGIEGCKKDLLINIYEAWIDKLESQGN